VDIANMAALWDWRQDILLRCKVNRVIELGYPERCHNHCFKIIMFKVDSHFFCLCIYSSYVTICLYTEIQLPGLLKL
jgi:hypothetical protein